MRIMVATGVCLSLLMGLLVMILGHSAAYVENARITGSATTLSDTISPTANAGLDQNVSVGAKVGFNASLSVDTGGSIANYTWSFIYDGVDTKIYGAEPSFTFEKAGEYVFTLNVTDEAGLSDTDQVVIKVAAEKADISSLIYSGGAAAVVAALLIVLFIVMRNSKGDGGKDEPSDGSEEEFEETEGVEKDTPKDSGP
jgi:hypothetical protein